MTQKYGYDLQNRKVTSSGIIWVLVQMVQPYIRVQKVFSTGIHLKDYKT